MRVKNICKFVSPGTPQGIVIKNFVYETDTAAMARRDPLPYARMYLVTGGEGCFVFDSERYALKCGELIFGFLGERASAEPKEGFEYMYITFDGERSEELLRRFGINRTCRRYDGFEGLIPLWKSTLSRVAQENVDIAAESILLHTFSRFDASRAEGSELLSRIVEFTEEHFSDSQLSISVVAEEVGYNSKYISHLFKEKMGVGYSEYLREIRIRYAVSLFEHGIDSVKNVALLSGFSDPLYFSSVFKKTVGISPRDYKSRSLGNDVPKDE